MPNPNRPVSLTPIDTAWGLAVADSVVRVYPNAASRDADLAGFTAADLLGQVVLLTDTGSMLVYAGASMGWRRPWADPWGIVGYAEANKQAGGDGSSIVAVALPTISPAWPVGRLLRITSEVYLKDASGTTYAGVFNQCSGSSKRVSHLMRTALTAWTSVTTFATVVPVTLAQVAAQIVGGATIDNFPGDPHLLMVEDVGPAVGPTALLDDGAGGVTLDLDAVPEQYLATDDPEGEPLPAAE